MILKKMMKYGSKYCFNNNRLICTISQISKLPRVAAITKPRQVFMCELSSAAKNSNNNNHDVIEKWREAFDKEGIPDPDSSVRWISEHIWNLVQKYDNL